MKKCYIPFSPKVKRAEKLELVRICDEIASKWNADGYDMTLRQLYYQLVSRNVVPNTERSYKNVGNLVSAARDGGLIDWRHIVDRTRSMKQNSHWDSPEQIIQTCARSYAIDTRSDQPVYIEVWVEKEALAGIVGGACEDLDVARFSCRGYASATAMQDAGRRFYCQSVHRERLVVLHLGDHDPSGIDMSEDIQKRLSRYSEYAGVEVKRIALTMDQVLAQSLPPNPAKLSDSRAGAYVLEHGYESWELDALAPQFIEQLIEDEVMALTDDDLWDDRKKKEKEERKSLKVISDNYDAALQHVGGADPDDDDDDDDDL